MKFDFANMTPDKFQDLHVTERWSFVLKLHEVFLDSPDLSVNDVMRVADETVSAIEVWWLSLSPEGRIEEAPFVKEFLDLADDFFQRMSRSLRAYTLKVHGVDPWPDPEVIDLATMELA